MHPAPCVHLLAAGCIDVRYCAPRGCMAFPHYAYLHIGMCNWKDSWVHGFLYICAPGVCIEKVLNFEYCFETNIYDNTQIGINTSTVKVEIFAQYKFSRISRMVSYARNYDVSDNLNHYRLDGIRYKMRNNMSTRKGH